MSLSLKLMFSFFLFLNFFCLELKAESLLYNCRNGSFPAYTRDFQIGEVLGKRGVAVYVVEDDDRCLDPASPKKKCSKNSFVLGGFEYLVSHQEEGWSCIYFKDSAAWIRTDQLKLFKPQENPKASDWTGVWKDGVNKVVIQFVKKKSQFKIKGEAYWYGAMLGPKEQVVHTGELEGEVRAVGNKLTIGNEADFESKEKYECVARFTLVNKSLVITDNSLCGGANVRFDGVYKRVKKN